MEAKLRFKWIIPNRQLSTAVQRQRWQVSDPTKRFSLLGQHLAGQFKSQGPQRALKDEMPYPPMRGEPGRILPPTSARHSRTDAAFPGLHGPSQFWSYRDHSKPLPNRRTTPLIQSVYPSLSHPGSSQLVRAHHPSSQVFCSASGPELSCSSQVMCRGIVQRLDLGRRAGSGTTLHSTPPWFR